MKICNRRKCRYGDMCIHDPSIYEQWLLCGVYDGWRDCSYYPGNMDNEDICMHHEWAMREFDNVIWVLGVGIALALMALTGA